MGRPAFATAGEGSAMTTLIIGVATAALAGIAFVVWWWSRTLAGVASGLEALRHGRKAYIVRSTAPGPVGRLVRAFNVVATEVQARTARLEQDRQQMTVVLEAMAEAVIAVDTRHHLLFANAGRLSTLRPGCGLGRSVGRGTDPQSAGPCGDRGDTEARSIRLPTLLSFPSPPGMDIREGRDDRFRCEGLRCPVIRRRAPCSYSTMSPTFAGLSGCGRTSSPTPHMS